MFSLNHSLLPSKFNNYFSLNKLACEDSRPCSLAARVAFRVRRQPSFFAPGPGGVSREGRLRFTAENSILMT